VFHGIGGFWLYVIENKAQYPGQRSIICAQPGGVGVRALFIVYIVDRSKGSFRPCETLKCPKVASLGFRNCHRSFTLG